MRVHRTSVGDIEIAEVEIPDMMSVEAAGDDFGMHRFVDGVKSVNRRTEIMVTRLLVHELFGDDAMLCHEPSGAPYVEKAGARMDMGFSLSHCRGWVVAAWSASERVGVDVEIVDKRVDRVKTACSLQKNNASSARRPGKPPWHGPPRRQSSSVPARKA